ncbi:MAG: HNH endonuclease [Scytonema sp. CRU_2_7]|nr:HNH endonuclease [Scytonema sp. CRU_2_7]
MDLSVADLLKNYLFSRASDKIKEVQKKWGEINLLSNRLELTKFIRHYWLSKYGLVTEKDLYRKIAEKLRTSSEIFDFVNQLREAVEIYSAFENSQSSVWDSYDSNLKKDIDRLNLFKVSQCYSVLLAAKECLTDELFTKVLRMIVILSFRYNVICKYNPSKLESAYCKTAKYIRDNKPKSAKPIFEQLKEFYPVDADFEKAFVDKSFTPSDTKLARYILSEINSHYMGHKELIANPNGTELNLEHILPQKPSDKWLVEFSNTDPNQYIYRLGNLTLLDSSVNRKVGNTSFEDKICQSFF